MPDDPISPRARRDEPPPSGSRRRLAALLQGRGGGGAPIALSMALLAVIVTAAALSVKYSLDQVTVLQARREGIDHTYRVLLSSSALLSMLKDAEAGQRGFLIARDEAFLERYHRAVAEIELELTRLSALVAGDPGQQTRLQEARRLIADKVAALEAMIETQRRDGPDAAMAMVRAGRGRQAMDSIRGLLTAISDEEQRGLNARESRLPPLFRQLRALLITRAVFLVLLLVAAWMLMGLLLRRRAQLARSRDLLATTLASIGDGVIVTDARGRVSFLNAEAERLTGWSDAEARGRGLPEVFSIVNETTRQPVQNPVEKVLELGTVVGLANHTTLIRRDGSELPIDDSAAPIRAPDGDELEGVILVFRDFSQHKALELQQREHQRTLETRVAERTRELELAHRRLRLTDRMAAVGTLASGLAHDMKNVLLPLSMQLDTVVSNPQLHADTRRDLAGISGLLEHLREMARNLSLFARDPEQEGIEGRTELSSWSQRVRAFIDASVLEDPRDPNRRITVEWQIPPRLPAVRVAPHRLTQAVLNLVHNARDAIYAARYPGPGGPPPRPDAGHITISAETRAGDSLVAICVRDDGCGMDEEASRRATEPFFTTKNRSGTPSLAGSGLGLSLASVVAERTGGRLDIDSRPGEGTTITLELPVVEPAPAAVPPRSAVVSIEDKARRVAVLKILRELRYDIAQGGRGAVWITEAAAVTPADAAEFLRQGPGRHVVVVGQGPDWQAAGAIVVDPGQPVDKLREIVEGLA